MFYFLILKFLFLFLYTWILRTYWMHTNKIMIDWKHVKQLPLYFKMQKSYCQNHLLKVNVDAKAASQNVKDGANVSFFPEKI